MTEYTMEDFRAEMKRRGIAPPRGSEEPRCECGEPKPKRASACDRCRHLDGTTNLRHEVIMALRGTDGLTLSEICEEVHGYATRSTNRSMLRIMQEFIRDGRVRRWWSDVEDSPEVNRRGWHGKPIRCVYGAWRYALHGDGRARRAA